MFQGRMHNIYSMQEFLFTSVKLAALTLVVSLVGITNGMGQDDLSASAKTLAAQNVMSLTIDEAVALAQGYSPQAKLASTQLSNRYWSYKSTLADFKPQINLTGTLPLLNRSFQTITQDDGEEIFVRQGLLRSSVGVDISQDIALTGGTIFANTSLERLDIFKQGSNPGSTSYLSTPVSVGYRQNLSGYNALKWTKQLAPLSYQEAQRQYQEDREDLALGAAARFFSVLTAQLNLEAAQIRESNADTLFAVSKGRFEVGRIAETELLQIELGALNANTEVEQARVNLQQNSETLRNYLGITEAVKFDLKPPTSIPDFSVNADTALYYARQNRSEIIGFRRRVLQAEEQLEAAKAESGISGDLFVTFSFAQSAPSLSEAYQDPANNQFLTLGFSVPIADFGKRRARREVAQSNSELEALNVSQERISLEQNVLLLVRQFDLLRNNVGLAKRAFDVSERALEITRQRYLIGKIGITQLNLAIQEQNKARVLYTSALQNFWLAYYELRLNTLYDFRTGKGLRSDVKF